MLTENWYPDEQIKQLITQAKRVASLKGDAIEIGCWEGRSAIHLANVFPDLIAVDSWKGNLAEGANHPTVEILKNRDVLQVFRQNMLDAGHNNVQVHVGDCFEFLIHHYGGCIKFCHLDASHDYYSVKRALELILPHMVDGGIVCGDDFINAGLHRKDLDGGVQRAVQEVLPGYESQGNFWFWLKKSPIQVKPLTVKPRLSVVMAVLNDPIEVNATIASIRATSGDKCEIIVVDDLSDKPVVLEDKDAILIRNDKRVGPGASRHIGAERSTGNFLLLLDSHMRFEPGWYEKAMARISDRPNVVHCASCCGLDTLDMHLEEFTRHGVQWLDIAPGRRVILDGKHVRKKDDENYIVMENGRPAVLPVSPKALATLPATARYYGAELNICGPNPNNPKEVQVFEGVWAKDRDGDDYEISCLMGACYFFSRDWFFHIGGLKWNKQWGYEEPNLALKTYLAGGSIRVMKGVRIGHKFHSGNPPYKLFLYWKHYNKIRSIMTIMSEDEAKILLPKLANEPDIKTAWGQIQRDRKEIEAEWKDNQTIFKYDLRWFCSRFNIPYPTQ